MRRQCALRTVGVDTSELTGVELSEPKALVHCHLIETKDKQGIRRSALCPAQRTNWRGARRKMQVQGCLS
jgi:hypothetical protein